VNEHCNPAIIVKPFVESPGLHSIGNSVTSWKPCVVVISIWKQEDRLTDTHHEKFLRLRITFMTLFSCDTKLHGVKKKGSCLHVPTFNSMPEDVPQET